VLQIQGVKGAAVVIYRKPLTTLEMRWYRLSRRVNVGDEVNIVNDVTKTIEAFFKYDIS